MTKMTQSAIGPKQDCCSLVDGARLETAPMRPVAQKEQNSRSLIVRVFYIYTHKVVGKFHVLEVRISGQNEIVEAIGMARMRKAAQRF